MASLTRWTWVWASSSSWWWTEKPDVLQSMGLQGWTWLSDWTELVGGSVSAKQLKGIVVCLPWGRIRTLPQGCTISWLLLPYLCIPSLPWLATVWTCALKLEESHGAWMKSISCNPETGDTERILCPGAPQGPTRFQRTVKDTMTASKSESMYQYITGT